MLFNNIHIPCMHAHIPMDGNGTDHNYMNIYVYKQYTTCKRNFT